MKPIDLLGALKEYTAKFPDCKSIEQLMEELQNVVDTEKMLEALKDKPEPLRVPPGYLEQIYREYEKWSYQKDMERKYMELKKQQQAQWDTKNKKLLEELKTEMLKY